MEKEKEKVRHQVLAEYKAQNEKKKELDGDGDSEMKTDDEGDDDVDMEHYNKKLERIRNKKKLKKSDLEGLEPSDAWDLILEAKYKGAIPLKVRKWLSAGLDQTKKDEKEEDKSFYTKQMKKMNSQDPENFGV